MTLNIAPFRTSIHSSAQHSAAVAAAPTRVVAPGVAPLKASAPSPSDSVSTNSVWSHPVTIGMGIGTGALAAAGVVLAAVTGGLSFLALGIPLLLFLFIVVLMAAFNRVGETVIRRIVASPAGRSERVVERPPASTLAALTTPAPSAARLAPRTHHLA